ncbi:MAG: hypothetical protein F9K42_11320 [Ignavibacterium sp.]|nr:MAG: hypothetical protein F9K42_11320 [Ignavibacterium sp.]
MTDHYLIKLGFSTLKDLIIDAQKRVYFAYPSLHPEVATAIEERIKNDNCDIRIIIDPSEKNFRQGFGDIKAVDKLRKLGVNIFEASDNLISFIISDERGYFIFPQSRILEEDGKLINAVRLSKLDILKITNYYFPPETIKEKDEFINLTSDSHQEVEEELKNIVQNIDKKNKIIFTKKLDETKLVEVRKNLEINKPLEPDIRRMIDVYTAKIQIVELSFAGVNFDVRKIPIPVEALPIRDDRLIQILETKIKLFENLRSDNALWKLKWLNNQVMELRKEYTISLKGKSNKRVIILNKKNEFLDKLVELNKEVDSLKSEALDLFDSEIEKALRTISDTLSNYLKEAKPDFVKK